MQAVAVDRRSPADHHLVVAASEKRDDTEAETRAAEKERGRG